jgi:hypothetical protein
MRILREGIELNTSLEQQALLAAWKIGSTDEARIRKRFGSPAHRLPISGYLLEFDYPIWSMKYRRSVL